MDVTQLATQLQQALQLNAELRLQQASLLQMMQQTQEESTSLRQQLETLRHDHAALVTSTQTLMADREQRQLRVAELEAINQRLVDMLWGRRSERRACSPDQLLLNFPEETPLIEEQTVLMAQQQAEEARDEELVRAAAARRRRRREEQRQTREFPEHLERRKRMLDLSAEDKVGLQCIGEVVTERMRFEKPHVYIERIVRPTYVVPDHPEQGVIAQPPPLNIVEGCKYDFSVIAAILAQKYAFHCPTYRQQDWFAQCGWFPSRSTLNELINTSVDVPVPLFGQMWHLLLQQTLLLTDDTRVLLLTRNSLSAEQEESLRARRTSGTPPGKEPQKLDERGSVTSYAWLYRGLDGLAPYNIFHWSLTHQHAVVDAHLASFGGLVVGDAFSGYTGIEDRSKRRIVHASCNAHARREIVKAEASEPILSAQAESLYRQLYDVEERGKTRAAQELLELRQREAVPIWQRFDQWLESEPVRRVLPQSPLGQAVGYMRNQWTALQRYLLDSRIPIDNSQSEQDLRPLTVGRSNWKFLGHPQTAAGRLQLLSIVSSAARHHLIVHDYLEDVLRKLADAAQHHPAYLELDSDYLLDLLPDRWASAHPQSMRHERVEEQQQIAENKRARRARQRLLERQRSANQR
ncbi:MAG: IS66 family transposase [Pirellulaceae bacterium]